MKVYLVATSASRMVGIEKCRPHPHRRLQHRRLAFRAGQ
jgi:hypothetical protein